MIDVIKKNGGILAIAALLSTGLVAITNALTADTIAEQQQKQLMLALNQVIPESKHDNLLYQSCTLINDKAALGTTEPQPLYIATLNEQPTALAFQAIAPDGYNGAIKVLIGTDMSGEVLGVRVLEHNETPGLGDKVNLSVSDWVLSFNGKRVEEANDARWAVHKDGGQFDQFTGATITPRAVVNATRKAIWYVTQNRSVFLEQPRNCGGEK